MQRDAVPQKQDLPHRHHRLHPLHQSLHHPLQLPIRERPPENQKPPDLPVKRLMPWMLNRIALLPDRHPRWIRRRIHRQLHPSHRRPAIHKQLRTHHPRPRTQPPRHHMIPPHLQLRSRNLRIVPVKPPETQPVPRPPPHRVVIVKTPPHALIHPLIPQVPEKRVHILQPLPLLMHPQQRHPRAPAPAHQPVKHILIHAHQFLLTEIQHRPPHLILHQRRPPAPRLTSPFIPRHKILRPIPRHLIPPLHHPPTIHRRHPAPRIQIQHQTARHHLQLPLQPHPHLLHPSRRVLPQPRPAEMHALPPAVPHHPLERITVRSLQRQPVPPQRRLRRPNVLRRLVPRHMITHLRHKPRHFPPNLTPRLPNQSPHHRPILLPRQGPARIRLIRIALPLMPQNRPAPTPP